MILMVRAMSATYAHIDMTWKRTFLIMNTATLIMTEYLMNVIHVRWAVVLEMPTTTVFRTVSILALLCMPSVIG